MLMIILLWCLSILLLEFCHYMTNSLLIGFGLLVMTVMVWILLFAGLELLGLTILVVYAAVFLILLIVSLGLTSNNWVVSYNHNKLMIFLVLGPASILASSLASSLSSGLLNSNLTILTPSWSEMLCGAHSGLSSSILSVIHAVLFRYFWVEGISLNLLLFVGFSGVLLTNFQNFFFNSYSSGRFSMPYVGAQSKSSSIWSSAQSSQVSS